MELINREALINKFSRLIAIPWNNKAAPISWADAYDSIIEDIEEAPMIDAVPVVRCKDCRFCFDGECMNYDNRIITKVPDFGEHYSYIAESKVPPEHYCSYGERK